MLNMSSPDILAEKLAESADNTTIERAKTVINVSGEYKDAREADFTEALEEVNLDDAVAGMFSASDTLRFGDIAVPENFSQRMRYLIAKNLAKEAAKQLIDKEKEKCTPEGAELAAMNIFVRAAVYATLMQKLTDKLLCNPGQSSAETKQE